MVQIPMKKAAEFGEKELILDGTGFEAIVLSVQEQDSRFLVDKNDPSQGYEREYSFKFKILDPGGPNDDRWIWGTTRAYFTESKNNKLRQWIIAILDLDTLPEGYVPDTTHLEGKQCRIIVDQWTSKNDPSRQGNSVGDVRPTKERGAAPAAAAATQSVPDYDEEPF